MAVYIRFVLFILGQYTYNLSPVTPSYSKHYRVVGDWIKFIKIWSCVLKAGM